MVKGGSECSIAGLIWRPHQWSRVTSRWPEDTCQTRVNKRLKYTMAQTKYLLLSAYTQKKVNTKHTIRQVCIVSKSWVCFMLHMNVWGELCDCKRLCNLPDPSSQGWASFSHLVFEFVAGVHVRTCMPCVLLFKIAFLSFLLLHKLVCCTHVFPCICLLL